MNYLFTEILYRPLVNALFYIYSILPGADFGVAIIVLTGAIKLIFLPLTIKTGKSQRALNTLGPEMQRIKEQFKNDKAAQSTAIMELYKKNKVNPLSGCLPLLIQLPVLIALYKAFMAGFNPENLSLLYDFVQKPEVINKLFLGWIDITTKNAPLAIIAGLAQAIQVKISGASAQGSKEMAALNKQMLYFFPIMIIIIGWRLPAGLTLYWVASTLFSVAEQAYIKKKYK